MKKLIVFLLLTSVYGSTIAQATNAEHKKLDLEYKKINGGFIAWVSGALARINGDSESYSSSVFGLNAGGSIPIYNFKNGTEVLAGANYSMQGSKYKSSEYVPGGYSNSVESSVRLNYLQFPVTARHNTKSGFYGEAGLQPAVLLSAKDKHNGKTEDIKDIYNGFDMSLIAGAGYQSKKKIGVAAQYAPGITNINKSSGPNAKAKDRNSVFSIRATYRF